jgi:hypothetical protein
VSARKASAAATLAGDDRQALVLVEHDTESQLVLGVIDAHGGMAALVLTDDAVRSLADALNDWWTAL